MAMVRVESIAAGGDGVGRLDGLAVFIPRTAPGELVDADVLQRGRMARGRLLQVIEPSADRVSPRCQHYDGDRCGGCQLQHLSYDSQLAAKQRIVQDAFARIVRRAVELPPIVASPNEWEYLSRLTLAMRWRDGAWIMGLHAFDDVDYVFDLRECPITNPRVVSAWAGVAAARGISTQRVVALRAKTASVCVARRRSDIAAILRRASHSAAAATARSSEDSQDFTARRIERKQILVQPADNSPRTLTVSINFS